MGPPAEDRPVARPAGAAAPPRGPAVIRALRADYRRRRWRRWSRRRLDALTAWVLAALVALSLFLGVLLWLVTPPLPAPLLAGGGAAYVIGDALGQASVAALLQPARVVLLYPGGPDVALGDPAANPLFGTLWSEARSLLGDVTPAELTAARPVSPEEVAGLFGARRAPRAVLEVDLGPRLAWGQWWEVFGAGRPWRGGPGPAFDRVYLAPGARATEVFLLSRFTGLELSLPGGQGRVLATLLLAQQGQPQPSGYAVAPLGPVADTAFGVEPGINVPTDPSWSPVALHAEPVDGARLAAAILGDPLAVRIYHGSDGTVTYSNPQDSTLQVRPGGVVSLTAPLVSAPPAGQDWLAGLHIVAGYVGRAGGWPPSAWLSSVVPVYPAGSCSLTTCTPFAYSYGFETRYQGLPVIDRAPAVSVTAAGAGVTAYARHVPLPGSPLPVGNGATWLPARAIVAALERNPPPSLYAPPLVIDDISPAWVPLPLAGVLQPAWAVRFVPLAGGPARLVLVDAVHGQVLAVLTSG